MDVDSSLEVKDDLSEKCGLEGTKVISDSFPLIDTLHCGKQATPKSAAVIVLLNP